MTFVSELSGVASKLAEARVAIERGAAEATRVGPLEMQILHPESRAAQLAALTEAGKGLRISVTEFDRAAGLVDESTGAMTALSGRFRKQGADLPMVGQFLSGTAEKVRGQAQVIRDGMERGDTLAMWPKHATLGSANGDINLALTMLNEFGAAPAALGDAAKAAAAVGRNVA